MHLPLIGQRPVTHVPTDVGVVRLLTTRQVLLESVQARENAALGSLGAVAGGQSLCDVPSGATSLPTVKYQEGAAAALAQARRAVRAVEDGPGAADAARSALLEVLAQWRSQSGSPGRTGPSWVSYLAGGRDALEQLVNLDTEGSMLMTRDEPVFDPASPEAVTVGTAPAHLGQPDRSTARRGLHNAADALPLRRLMVVAVLFPLLFTLLVVAAGGWAPSAAPAWTALVALVALGGATTLATYLPRPGSGHRLDIGCTPCAAVAGLSVLGASFILSTAPHDQSTAALALVIIGFGLAQRLTSPSTCATPAPRPELGDQHRP